MIEKDAFLKAGVGFCIVAATFLLIAVLYNVLIKTDRAGQLTARSPQQSLDVGAKHK